MLGRTWKWAVTCAATCTTALVLFSAPLTAALAAPARPIAQHYAGRTASFSPRGWPIVRGLEGQADLVLDVGRRLQGYPLRKAAAQLPSGKFYGGRKLRLHAVEKARLDARRVAWASRLDTHQKIERFIAIVRHRMPPSVEGERRYEWSSDRQVRRWGVSRLSHYTRQRVGICRERSFLLKALLDEAGLEAVVRYGALYDHANSYLGGHAWVEVSADGRTLILDPSLKDAVWVKTSIGVEEALPDGTTRTVDGAQTPHLLYVPTDDLQVSPPAF